MKITLMAIVLAAAPAGAAEMFTGTHVYQGDSRAWMTAPGVGYSHFNSKGQIAMQSGPLPNGPVECHGTSYWTTETSEAEGICVFGETTDRWTVRYRMFPAEHKNQRAERFNRRGEWTVIGGTGRYENMTGAGTYLAEQGDTTRPNITRWQGEVTLAD